MSDLSLGLKNIQNQWTMIQYTAQSRRQDLLHVSCTLHARSSNSSAIFHTISRFRFGFRIMQVFSRNRESDALSTRDVRSDPASLVYSAGVPLATWTMPVSIRISTASTCMYPCLSKGNPSPCRRDHGVYGFCRSSTIFSRTYVDVHIWTRFFFACSYLDWPWSRVQPIDICVCLLLRSIESRPEITFEITSRIQQQRLSKILQIYLQIILLRLTIYLLIQKSS
jgi:hypothetical protein